MNNFQVVQQVYGDSTVLINDLYIQIKKYYFPLGTSKTIFYSEIDRIIYHPRQDVKQLWGVSLMHLNNWFPLDELRAYKHGYFQIVIKDMAVRPSFSPIQPQRAFLVLWQNQTKEGKMYKDHVKRQNQKIIEEIRLKEEIRIKENQPQTESAAKQENNQNYRAHAKQTLFEQKQTGQNLTINKRIPLQDITNTIAAIAQKDDIPQKQKFFQESSTEIRFIDFVEDQALKESQILLEEREFEDLQ